MAGSADDPRRRAPSEGEMARTDVPLRPAATVMLLRDHPDEGLQVFMLQRTLSAAFARGMYVFPGGRVDPADAFQQVESVCHGLGDAEASEILGVRSGGLAYWVAAIRECFEEAGVLLAADPSSSTGTLGDLADRTAERAQVHAGELSMVELCHRLGVSLLPGTMHYVSHWITPVGESRRFDTRFFLAPAPADQVPVHDDSETVDSLWISPTEALHRHERRELAMIPPTIANLEMIVGHRTVAEACAAAAAMPRPTAIEPRLRIDGDGRVVGVILPGEPGFDDAR
jgi:8-oxo-dGTP pyrophosphatase MutT (NUDIX family)